MINTREFRIGNLLIEKNSGQIIEVINISQKHISFSGQFKSGWQAEPIPITEEWLVRFGGYYHDNNKSWMYIDIPNTDSEIFYSFDFESGCSLFVNDEEIIMDRIKHVHQLQNLCHALTGEELKLKDK